MVFQKLMTVNFNIVVFGGGSGLGKSIVETELSLGNSVLAFTSKNRFSDNANLSYVKINFHNLDIKLVAKATYKLNIEKFYFCSVSTNFEKFANIKPNKIETEVSFNISNILILIQFILKAHSETKLIYILSHICFIYSPGFSLYRMNKKAIEDLILSLELEYPNFKVTRVYPGAMNTNFVKNTNYSGISIFRRKDPGWWANKIVNSNKKVIITKTDNIIKIFDYALPFFVKKWIYKKLVSS
tara:strand:+ start:423 stop:1148 length:726 start_codon:yes stop_codon:yes gene_type:complete